MRGSHFLFDEVKAMSSWMPLGVPQLVERTERLRTAERVLCEEYPSLRNQRNSAGELFDGGRYNANFIGFLDYEGLLETLASKGKSIDEAIVLAFGLVLESQYGFEWLYQENANGATQFGMRQPGSTVVLAMHPDFILKIPTEWLDGEPPSFYSHLGEVLELLHKDRTEFDRVIDQIS
jgi:hypothetical protein